jgi:hypothetical protein
VQALSKPASCCYREVGAHEYMLVGIAVSKSGKARCGIGLPLPREDQGELTDRARETQVPERAGKFERSECRGAAGLDLIIEDQKAG